MYWLLHTGICCDDRYEQVKEQVIKHKLNEIAVNGDDYMVKKIRQCLVFFDELGDYDNVSLSTKYNKVRKDLFLLRRANTIYITQNGYQAKKDSFEKWWLSVALHPTADEHSVHRMYWLNKSLTLHNQWNVFEEKLQSENIDVKNPPIVLLNYVCASNPNTEKKAYFANKFLQELHEHKKVWDDYETREWVGAMLCNLKGLYTKTQLLQEVMDFYFHNEFDSEEYRALFEYYFADDTEAQVKDLLGKMHQLRNKTICVNGLKAQKAVDYAKQIVEFQNDDVMIKKIYL